MVRTYAIEDFADMDVVGDAAEMLDEEQQRACEEDDEGIVEESSGATCSLA